MTNFDVEPESSKAMTREQWLREEADKPARFQIQGRRQVTEKVSTAARPGECVYDCYAGTKSPPQKGEDS